MNAYDNNNDYVIHNGNIIKKQALTFLDVERAFRFGDSWFETMFVHNGEIRYWDYHKRRLIKAFEAAGELCEGIEEQIRELYAYYGDADARVRFTVFRVHGHLYTPLSDAYSYLLEWEKWQIPDYSMSRIDFSEDIILFSKRLFPGKSGNSAPYIQASKEAAQRKLTQIVLCNEKGEIAETANANLFWRIGDIWYTPDLNSGCVEGVMRAALLRFFKEQGMTCREVSAAKEQLFRAEEICVTNAIIGVKNVHLLADKALHIHVEKIFE